jgi:hypothetical protein
MNIEKVKNELWKIGQVYPTIGGTLKKTISGGLTVGHKWAAMMIDLDPVEFENVVDEFASFERELPTPDDRLPYEIISICKDRVAEQVLKLEQHTKWHQKQPPWRDEVPAYLWCQIVKWILDNPQPPERAEQLAKWGAGRGSRPEWLEQGAIA